jgi:hypothetical protein
MERVWKMPLFPEISGFFAQGVRSFELGGHDELTSIADARLTSSRLSGVAAVLNKG